jgi:hypothetical protein
MRICFAAGYGRVERSRYISDSSRLSGNRSQSATCHASEAVFVDFCRSSKSSHGRVRGRCCCECWLGDFPDKVMFLSLQFAVRVSAVAHRHVAKHWRLTTSQSMPSLMPRPSIAEQAMMLQLRSLSSPSFSASEMSPAPFAPGWSCLFGALPRSA